MATRYRVERVRAGHHVPGLVGDFDSKKAAREAALACKADCAAGDRVTIQPGTDTPWAEQPEERRHEYGHHFLAGSEPAEEV